MMKGKPEPFGSIEFHFLVSLSDHVQSRDGYFHMPTPNIDEKSSIFEYPIKGPNFLCIDIGR